MRFPASFSCWAVLSSGIIPSVTIGPLLQTALHFLGPKIPEYSLAVWHGFTSELLMSVVAILGGVAAYFTLRPYLLVSEGPPLLRYIKSQRIFDDLLVTVSWRFARWLENAQTTNVGQPREIRMLIRRMRPAAFHALLHFDEAERAVGEDQQLPPPARADCGRLAPSAPHRRDAARAAGAMHAPVKLVSVLR